MLFIAALSHTSDCKIVRSGGSFALTKWLVGLSLIHGTQFQSCNYNERKDMAPEVSVETPHDECIRLAQRLIQVDKHHELLRFFFSPETGEVWREIRSEFFRRFGPDGVSVDQCVGPHLEHFRMKLAGALRRALLDKNIDVD